MPVAVEFHSAHLPSGARRKLTREDCHALEQAGRLERESFELIDGELVQRMGKSRLHTLALRRLVAWLHVVFGAERVDQEVPIDLSEPLNATNEPEPDAIVLRHASEAYPVANLGPEDVLLAVEVSATTQDYDLGAKAALYAAGGIRESWVLDLREPRFVVHREPSADGYRSIVSYGADEAVAPLAAPAAMVRAQDFAA
ncbi:MAG: Uma2 family endonuclease [Bryobacteraceae bacterium]|nr:Uma2 family endonuclease [Bryobacteraceae bacterium]